MSGSSNPRRRMLVVQVAALSRGYSWPDMRFAPLASVFPALTCTVQASFRTASQPSAHGMVANGVYCRQMRKAMFWEQSSALVAGERIWHKFRQGGGKVAMLFWQQSLGESADIVLSPAPIHKHHGGMIEDCYSRPAGLYSRLCREVGRPFRLRHYWGPLASPKAGRWIAEATAALLRDRVYAPDLCLTYMPSLDYELQRSGPDGAKAAGAVAECEADLRGLIDAARAAGYEVVVFGDYQIMPVRRAVFPNRALAQAGLLATREVAGRLYADLHAGKAFAMVDHQAAHVYVSDAAEVDATRRVFASLDGVAAVLDRTQQAQAGVNHANSGELVLRAAEDAWFAYPWWQGDSHAPDYARHVDIHNKPGYDPCELFAGWPPWSVSLDASRIGGSHGLAGPDHPAAWASTVDFSPRPGTIIELAQRVRDWMGEERQIIGRRS